MNIIIIDNMTTTIAITEDIRERLKDYGRKGDTYNKIISNLLHIVGKDRYMEEIYSRSEEKGKFLAWDDVK